MIMNEYSFIIIQMEEFQDTTLVEEIDFRHEMLEEQACMKSGCNATFMSDANTAGTFIRYCGPCLEALKADLDGDMGLSQSSMSSTGIAIPVPLADAAGSTIPTAAALDISMETDLFDTIPDIQLESAGGYVEPNLPDYNAEGLLMMNVVPPMAEMNMNDILDILHTMSRTKTRQPGIIVIGIYTNLLT
jgi:hypothetical protein